MSPDTKEREFDLADVLAVTTGTVVRRGQYFDFGQPTEQIVRLMTTRHDDIYAKTSKTRREAAEAILVQHPELRSVDVSGLTRENAEVWLEEQRAKFGQKIKLTTLNPNF